MKTVFTVESCSLCPFYERTPASVLADFITKSSQRTGTCRYGALDQPFPHGRRHVPDAGKTPIDCPLRSGEAVIVLGTKP